MPFKIDRMFCVSIFQKSYVRVDTKHTINFKWPYRSIGVVHMNASSRPLITEWGGGGDEP